jgi:hypothetical protein
MIKLPLVDLVGEKLVLVHAEMVILYVIKKEQIIVILEMCVLQEMNLFPTEMEYVKVEKDVYLLTVIMGIREVV